MTKRVAEGSGVGYIFFDVLYVVENITDQAVRFYPDAVDWGTVEVKEGVSYELYCKGFTPFTDAMVNFKKTNMGCLEGQSPNSFELSDPYLPPGFRFGAITARYKVALAADPVSVKFKTSGQESVTLKDLVAPSMPTDRSSTEFLSTPYTIYEDDNIALSLDILKENDKTTAVLKYSNKNKLQESTAPIYGCYAIDETGYLGSSSESDSNGRVVSAKDDKYTIAPGIEFITSSWFLNVKEKAYLLCRSSDELKIFNMN